MGQYKNIYFTFLGLTLNKHLGWADHVNKPSNKICKVIRMKKLKFQLPHDILLSICNSLILSQLNLILSTCLGLYESKEIFIKVLVF